VPDFDVERRHFESGRRRIAGVDEAGRGALCGPVVAAAVILPSKFLRGRLPSWLRKADDSKLLTPRRRAELVPLIAAEAESVGLGLATHREIDRLNIFRASHLAMRRAVETLSVIPDIVLVDGPALRDFPFPQDPIPQGDRRCYSIAAASIVAKVVRDGIMSFSEVLFPGYGFERNKGYGTRAHYEALEARGPSSFHRRSFKLQYQRKLF
jgi:ribonuclease HII